jgi:formyltetrahydrofolate hydrolase
VFSGRGGHLQKELLEVRNDTAILLIDSPDRKGLVASIAQFLYSHNANILHADHHRDDETGLFLMRIEWELRDFTLDLAEFERAFAPMAHELQLHWRLERSTTRPRMAIFVSQYDHCLADLLYRHRSGELACDIAIIIGNHATAQPLADFYGIPFHVIEVKAATKHEARSETACLVAPAQCRFRRSGTLYADFVIGICRAVSRGGSSTSTIPFYQRSAVHVRTSVRSSVVLS